MLKISRWNQNILVLYSVACYGQDRKSFGGSWDENEAVVLKGFSTTFLNYEKEFFGFYKVLTNFSSVQCPATTPSTAPRSCSTKFQDTTALKGVLTNDDKQWYDGYYLPHS